MGGIIDLTGKNLPPACFVFKHSTRCPVSRRAAEEVRGLSWDPPLYWISVVEQRELSNWVAEEYGTRHESPQLLRIEEGRVRSVWNHREITRENIEGGGSG